MKNIKHLEDLVFFEEPATIVEIVSALLFWIKTPLRNIGDLSIKYDGAPLIVFGNEEGFFVSDKRYLNKTPVRYYSIEDIEKDDIAEAKKDKLTSVFHEYADSGIKHEFVYYADFLFSNYYEHLPMVTDSFQPNIIRYELVREKLTDYHLGLAPHTKKFCKIHDMVPNLPENHRVWEPPMEPYGFQDEFEKSNEVFDLLGGVSKDYEFSNLSSKDIKELRSYLNKLVREYPEYNENQLLYYHDKNLHCLAESLDALIKIKYLFLEFLNKGKHSSCYNLTINDQSTTHEGYVYKYDGHVVKLVDRFGFSKANFLQETSRGWQKN